jgi:hypothetical protein
MEIEEWLTLLYIKSGISPFYLLGAQTAKCGLFAANMKYNKQNAK